MRVEGGWTEDQPGNCCAVAGWGRGDAGGCCMPIEMQKADRSSPKIAPVRNWLREDTGKSPFNGIGSELFGTTTVGTDPTTGGTFGGFGL